MARKAPWQDYAIDMIKSTNRCPGSFPPTGLPTDLVSLDEFRLMCKAGGTHEWNACHFENEVFGLPSEGMHPVDIDAVKVSEGAKSAPVAEFNEVGRANRLVDLKARLHGYVDNIKFRENGALYVPKPLLELASFVNRFFAG